jgi:hypothetical protein
LGQNDFTTGVQGESQSGVGVGGTSDTGTGVLASSKTGIALVASTGGGVCASFTGDVHILGSLQAALKPFRIDHPLDPANKYLLHASVESTERKNLYDGISELDENGTALIVLPDWFEALNEDFRYQLTPIGGPAPDLHVANEVANGQFRIAGGRPGMRICWQVTGVRRDALARYEPMQVEQEKPIQDRGYYQNPEAHGMTREMGIANLREAQRMSAVPPVKPEIPRGGKWPRDMIPTP